MAKAAKRRHHARRKATLQRRTPARQHAIVMRRFGEAHRNAGAARDIGYGRALSLAVPADPTALVHDGRLLALYRPAASGSEPVAVLA